VDEHFGLVAKFDVDTVYYESEDTYNVVHNLVETPLVGCCEVHVREESFNLVFNYVFPNPLDHSHDSPMCSHPLTSLEYYFNVAIDDLMICNSNADLGYEDNMFHIVNGNVYNFLSLVVSWALCLP